MVIACSFPDSWSTSCTLESYNTDCFKQPTKMQKQTCKNYIERREQNARALHSISGAHLWMSTFMNKSAATNLLHKTAEFLSLTVFRKEAMLCPLELWMLCRSLARYQGPVMLLRLSMLYIVSVICLGQQPSQPTAAPLSDDARAVLSKSLGTSSTHGAADWRKNPSDARTQKDELNPQLRVLRNRYWLEHPMASDKHPLSWQLSSDQSDDPGDHVGLIAVEAKVDHQKVFQIGEDSAYTEVKLDVTDVISGPASLVAGSTMDLMIPGGSFIDTKGISHHASLLLERYPVQPGHEYLLILREVAPRAYRVVRKWEVIDGIVVPAGEREIIAFRKGNSALSGKSVQEARSTISAMLATSQEAR